MTSQAVGDRPLRVGVVGLGWAGQSHMTAYESHPGIELVAIAGREPDLRAELGGRFNIEAAYESADSLLEHPKLDAVSVATPTFLHAPISIAALQAGLHVLCEKPLGRTAQEAASVVQAAARNDRVLDVAFNKRGRPAVIALQRLIAQGRLGRIYYGRAHWLRRAVVPPDGSWFLNQEAAGGGALVDTGVHVLDLALHVLGEPRVSSVSAVTFAELGPRGLGRRPVTLDLPRKQMMGTGFEVEDFAAGLLRFDDGGALQLECSWAAYQDSADSFGLELFGTEAGARLEIGTADPSADTLSVFGEVAGVPAKADVPRPPASTVATGSHADIVSTFVAHVTQGRPADLDLHDVLSRSSIIDACYLSGRSGQQERVVPGSELLSAG
ncbi:Gfo/Idh/MocA family oxidoreductase [Kribbella pittospori]|uniref:Gfo/Idh/MocA family oxidoreductase n=1 Tax=Kribbella pittospori TaxID=722689 RepID=A0A4R0K1C9_9ACTN|nr:Gfo/Idh/MocA family oxidoreductase [Kribbella pittospori]TCC51478.1 Gfo/Idh/MocA family oxidoreductase [Kribbella pittospori]